MQAVRPSRASTPSEMGGRDWEGWSSPLGMGQGVGWRRDCISFRAVVAASGGGLGIVVSEVDFPIPIFGGKEVAMG